MHGYPKLVAKSFRLGGLGFSEDTEIIFGGVFYDDLTVGPVLGMDIDRRVGEVVWGGVCGASTVR